MAVAKALRLLWPAAVALLVAAAFAGVRLAHGGGNPLALATLGDRFAGGDPAGSEGYDGQFNYYIARDWDPESVQPHLDVPAYRYQRILYPALARALASGDPGRIAWALPAISLLAHFLGTLAVAAVLDRCGLPTGYALVYGLWVGVAGAAGIDLSEPLAYGLAAAGFLCLMSDRPVIGSAALTLGLLSKETTIFFWLAAWLAAGLTRQRKALMALSIGGLVFAAWQAWLWARFGSAGIGSGGAGASGFEWLPFMGLVRVAAVDLTVFALFLTLLAPGILLPAVWGVYAAGRRLWRGDRGRESLALLLNAGVIAFLPFSTFREPFAMVRLACGLVLAVTLFCAAQRWRRPLNYALFWTAGLILLARL
jgi:hypothetical protein